MPFLPFEFERDSVFFAGTYVVSFQCAMHLKIKYPKRKKLIFRSYET